MSALNLPILVGLGTAANIAANTTRDGEAAFGTDTHELYVRYGGVVYTIGGGGGPTSPLTTTGDLWGFDSADARIPVGADGYVLTADSGDPLGVSWQPVGDSSYTAGTPSDWDTSAPTFVWDALDRIAALLKVLNGGTGP